MDERRLKIEEVGVPTELSPQLRHARLKKDLENGIGGERRWIELCELSIELGHLGDAGQALRNIVTPDEVSRLRRLLERYGVILHEPERLGGRPSREPTRSRSSSAPGTARRPGASPPRVTGGPAAVRPVVSRGSRVGVHDGESVREECADALGYCLSDHMPLTSVSFVLLFPAVAFASEFIPSGLGEPASFLLRLLPGLLVLGTFLFAARRILLDAARGAEEPMGAGELLHGHVCGGVKVLGGFAILAVTCVGPALLALLWGMPALGVALLGVVGLFYLPMALIGLALRGSFEGSLPGRVLSAMAVDARDYVLVAIACSVALALPALGALGVLGWAPHLQLAMIGPILVPPGFACARLLGRFFYARANGLSRALGIEAPAPPTQQRVRSGLWRRVRSLPAGRAPAERGRGRAETPAAREPWRENPPSRSLGRHSHTPLNRSASEKKAGKTD